MITIHTPKGSFTFDPDIVTDEEMAKMGTKREYLPMPEPVRDPLAEIDELKAKIAILEKR